MMGQPGEHARPFCGAEGSRGSGWHWTGWQSNRAQWAATASRVQGHLVWAAEGSPVLVMVMLGCCQALQHHSSRISIKAQVKFKGKNWRANLRLGVTPLTLPRQ